MGIGDVFARAWDLWRRDVGWLILAGLVVGAIMGVLMAILMGVSSALFAGAGLASFSAGTADGSPSSLNGLGTGLLAGAGIASFVASFIGNVLWLTFLGGMFEMVIGAYREQRGVAFGDLFAGFRKFGSYVVFALVMLGIGFVLGLLNFIPFLGQIIAFVVMVWIAIVWLYVLPLIADQGLGFGEAAGASHRMIKTAGWWWTFGMVILLGLAMLGVALVIFFVTWAAARSNVGAGLTLGLVLSIVFGVLFGPYAICYVSVLYVASGGEGARVPAGGGMSLPPAPPAPSAYGAPPPPAPYAYAASASTPVTRPAYGAPAGADAWRAAADPLAAAPPPLPQMARPQAAAETTAVTQAQTEAPQAPEAPPPPPPPAGGF